MLGDLPLEDRDTNGDLYEYLLSKIAAAGTNGQFRTPRHIIKLMVEMMEPKPGDEICDPACGTAGFLVAAAEHIRERHADVLFKESQREHFHKSMFHGYDFDSTMLRIGSMNMLQHGIESPDIRYRDSLSEGASEDSAKYSLILANPPFAGSLDYETTSKDPQRIVKTKKTELLFLALFLKLLKTDPVLKKNKVLIFSEFSDTAHYLKEELVKSGVAGVEQIDSGTKRNRAQVIRCFAPYYNGSTSAGLSGAGFDEIRVLISTDVLSEGLNLQDATRLINYDLHWNPVRLMQRIGRSHAAAKFM